MARKKWKKKEKQVEPVEIIPEKKKGKLRPELLLGAFLLILVAGYFFLGQPTTPPPTTPPTLTIKGNHVFLSDKPSTHTPGKVTIVEFFDFYCSHCYTFHKERWPVLKERYGEKIQLVDRGYPLREASILPIEAYEIAKDMGRGDDLKDALFNTIHVDKKDISDVDTLSDIAGNLGLNREVFRNALSSRSKSQVVDANVRLGNSYGLTGTPTFIIDGNIKVTDYSVANFAEIIDSILEGE